MARGVRELRHVGNHCVGSGSSESVELPLLGGVSDAAADGCSAPSMSLTELPTSTRLADAVPNRRPRPIRCAGSALAVLRCLNPVRLPNELGKGRRSASLDEVHRRARLLLVGHFAVPCGCSQKRKFDVRSARTSFGICSHTFNRKRRACAHLRTRSRPVLVTDGPAASWRIACTRCLKRGEFIEVGHTRLCHQTISAVLRCSSLLSLRAGYEVWFGQARLPRWRTGIAVKCGPKPHSRLGVLFDSNVRAAVGATGSVAARGRLVAASCGCPLTFAVVEAPSVNAAGDGFAGTASSRTDYDSMI
jgi:hypothetical protein